MILPIDRNGLGLILVLAIGLLLAATRVSDGFYIIDEVVYFIGAEALWKTGSFVVQNGFGSFSSDNLRIWLLSDGPLGLTPQYPVGTALAAQPLMGMFGQRTLIVLNVIAGIGTLCLTHGLTHRLFGEQRIAFLTVVLLAFCTFWVDFVLAHWPHSISIFFTTLAIYLFVVARDRDSRVWRISLLSGVALGIGMFFRLEAVLLLPAFAAAAILLAVKPVTLLLGGAAGFLPFLAATAVANEARFGSFMPLSYGSTGGATVATHYIVPAAIMLCAVALLILYRNLGGFGQRGARVVAIALAICVAAVAMSPHATTLSKFLQGIYALFFDATTISDPRSGIRPQPDGTLLFWGFPKKALGQSMPWLGCLVLLAGVSLREQKRNLLTILIVVVIWSMPFVMRSWHGGLGSSMRYFLPTLPLLAAVSAWLIFELGKKADVAVFKFLFVGAVFAFALSLAWSTAVPDRIAQLHQFVSLGMLFAVITVCVLAVAFAKNETATLALLFVSFGMGLSTFLGYDDVNGSQARRTTMEKYDSHTATIDGPVVLFAAPEAVASAFDNDEQLVALPHPVTGDVDEELVNEACRSGYKILLSGGFVRSFMNEEYEVVAFDRPDREDAQALFEVVCRRKSD